MSITKTARTLTAALALICLSAPVFASPDLRGPAFAQPMLASPVYTWPISATGPVSTQMPDSAGTAQNTPGTRSDSDWDILAASHVPAVSGPHPAFALTLDGWAILAASDVPALSADTPRVTSDWNPLAGSNVQVLSAEAGQPNLGTYWNIYKHLGVVPKFFQLFPETALPAVWNEYLDVELNPDTALDARTKELIALAVAAEAGCSGCVYFHTSAALANGATGKEIHEAIAVSVIGGTWSKILKATALEMVKQDTNTLMSIGAFSAKPRTPALIN